MINLNELKNKEPVWYDVIAAPKGQIYKEQEYKYMIAYSHMFGLDFYWSDEDRHIPTFSECKGKYLQTIDFFGGAAFYFNITNNGNENWSYGKYGPIKELI